MAKWQLQTNPTPDLRAQEGAVLPVGVIRLNLFGVTDELVPIPGKHIDGLDLVASDVDAALALPTPGAIGTALKALIRAALPDDWDGEILVGYEDAINTADAFRLFVEDTLGKEYPFAFDL